MEAGDFDLKHKDTKVGKNSLKRQRSENWNEVDKELLKELIKKRVKDVENKNTDTNTNQTKKKAWLDIEKDFNSLCSCEKRTVCQLKSQWTSMKIQAKKEMADYRLKAAQTGSDISVWLPNEFVIDSNDYDSDFIFMKNKEKNSATCYTIDEISTEAEKVVTVVKEEETEFVPCIEKKFSAEKNNVVNDSIACSDAEYRKDLHLLQIEVEKKKLRNLDLEYEVLQAKFNFYKKKSLGMN